ncbi:hypothetical protein GCM10025759_28930 [Lysobacter panacisoli]|uniref:Uncharacterized protein n=1 Tax=Lysobacter panacisoli TaxID=1255263 RepID=A0ABP9LJV7_9GAMM
MPLSHPGLHCRFGRIDPALCDQPPDRSSRPVNVTFDTLPPGQSKLMSPDAPFRGLFELSNAVTAGALCEPQ